jgi:hypothetical protein
MGSSLSRQRGITSVRTSDFPLPTFHTTHPLSPQHIEEDPLKRLRGADRKKPAGALLRQRLEHLPMRRAVFLIDGEQIAGGGNVEMRRGFRIEKAQIARDLRIDFTRSEDLQREDFQPGAVQQAERAAQIAARQEIGQHDDDGRGPCAGGENPRDRVRSAHPRRLRCLR